MHTMSARVTVIMTDSHLRQYLLGGLSGDEIARVEEAVMMDDGCVERLRELELDLLDDYAMSRLSAAEADAVERHLLGSAENRRSVQIARALRKQLESDARTPTPKAYSPPPSPMGPPAASRRRSVQIAWAATLIAACLIGIAVIPRWRAAQQPVNALSPSTGPQAARATASTAVSALRIVSLLADVSRGAADRRLTMEPGDVAVRLQAEVPEPVTDTSYTLVIKDDAGRILFDEAALAVHAAGPYRYVEAVVPTAALAPGDRTVVLTRLGAALDVPVTFHWKLTGVVASPTKK